MLFSIFANVLLRCNLLVAVNSPNTNLSSFFGNFKWTIIFNNGIWGSDCKKQIAPVDDICDDQQADIKKCSSATANHEFS